MSKSKVLHIVGGMNIGGTETMLMNLYREVNNDIQFDFVSYYKRDGYYDEEIRELGGNIIKLNAPNEIGSIKAIKELSKVIKENGPYEAVHSHTLFNCGIANIAAKLSGVKIRIAHAHTTLDNNEGLIRKIYIILMRSVIKIFSTDFLACSNSAGKYLFGKNIVNNKRYDVIPNYIDYKKFLECEDKFSIRKELGLDINDKLVVHVGRFVKAKNHKFLVQIINGMVKRDKNVKAVFVGDGDLRLEIEEMVRNLELENNIIFLGLRKDINTILNNSDIFIFPSIYEGLGLVMLEAQASGLPCIVSEAIQPEANLDIGLIKQLKISDGIDKWVDESFKSINSKNKSIDLIEEAFKEKGYKIENIVNNLLDIYKLRLG